MFLLKNKLWFFLGILIILSGCRKTTEHGTDKPSNYADKFWAHKVNDTLTAQKKQHKFAGMEVDLVYSTFQNELFVGHELYDTIKRISFKQWIAALDNPKEARLWLDVKNLSPDNADAIGNLISTVTDLYGNKDNILVEHTSHHALEIIKQKGLPVLLWVDNLYWWDSKDTVTWLKITQKKIRKLKPDGLSCEYRLYPLLNNSFPEENIYYWHTPCEKTPENVALDKQMAKEQNIKVILVDYDEPVDF